MDRNTNVADAAVAAFLSRAQRVRGVLGQILPVALLANPTEELLDAANRRVPVSLYARNLIRRPQKKLTKAVARLEENYLFSSRRFPSSANNTIGSGALAVNTYPFFSKAKGDDGSGAGFPTGFTMDETTTNIETGGSIPQGTSFVFNQIGVSFNSDAATGDVNQLLEAAALQFKKSGGQFNLDHGPLKMWPSGMGADGYAATAVGGSPLTISAAHNGSADIRAVRNLRIARVLKEKETFVYNMVIPRTTKATDGTAWALANFVVATIWLWGGQKNVIPT